MLSPSCQAAVSEAASAHTQQPPQQQQLSAVLIAALAALATRWPVKPVPPPESISAVYEAAFDLCWRDLSDAEAAQATRALQLIVSSVEPPPLDAFEALGLRETLARLPLWGTLFQETGGRVFPVHETLGQWLVGEPLARGRVSVGGAASAAPAAEAAAGGAQAVGPAEPPHRFVVDPVAGHRAWAAHCSALALSPSGAAGGGDTISLHERFALRGVLAHLAASSEWAKLAAALLDFSLWERCFRDGSLERLLIEDVASAVRGAAKAAAGADAAAARAEAVAADVLRWLLSEAHRMREEPSEVLQRARAAPPASAVAQAALALGRAPPLLVVNPPEEWGPEIACSGVLAAAARSASFSPDGLMVVVSVGAEAQIRRSTGHLVAALPHATPVRTCAWSPDGTLIATGAKERSVRVFDAATGDLVLSLKMPAEVFCLTFSPTSRTVLAGGADRSLRVIDARMGLVRRALKGASGRVLCCGFSPNARSIVSGGDDKMVRIFDGPSGNERAALAGHTDSVNCVKVSSDGAVLLSASDDRTLRTWDMSSGQQLRVLNGHTGFVWSCGLSPDGTTAATASADHTVRFWDLASGSCIDVISGHKGAADARVTSTLLLSASVWWWSALIPHCGGKASSQRRPHVTRAVSSHLSPTADWVNTVAFSPDGRTICSGSSDKTLRFWTAPSDGRPLPRRRKHHPGPVLSCGWSPDGARLASGSGLPVPGAATATDSRASKDGSAGAASVLKVWDAGSGRCEAALVGHSGDVSCVAFSPDGATVLSGSWDESLRLWPAAAAAAAGGGPAGSRAVLPATDRVFCCAFTPDGRTVVSGEGRLVRLFDSASGAEVRSLSGHAETVTCCAVSSDGTTVLSGSYDRTLRLFDLETGACRHVLGGFAGMVLCCALSPDGRLAVGGAADTTLRVFDAASRSFRHSVMAPGAVACCAFRPGDGGAVVLCGAGSAALLVDPAAGEIKCSLTRHKAPVSACAWVGRGAVVTASADGTARWWRAADEGDVASFRPAATFFCEGRITSFAAAVAPAAEEEATDGHHVALGTDEGAVLIVKCKLGN